MHHPITSTTPAARRRNRLRSCIAAGALAAVVLSGGLAHAATTGDDAPPPEPSASTGAIASFEGGWLDLAESWGEATACNVTTAGVHCYRTEAEMDLAEGLQGFGATLGGDRSSGSSRPAARLLLTCSTTLRLYRSSNYAGGVLAMSTRQVVMNLSAYGFDNDTSSYRTGACSATFWENANGLGSVYPGLTVANVSSPSMVAGWDNRVSSVYIS